MGKSTSIPILVKYVLSNTTDNTTRNAITSLWQITYAQIEQNGSVANERFGLEKLYDLVIILDNNSKNRAITEETIFLINEMPTVNYENGNYEVAKIYPMQNGKIRIGLNAKGGQSQQKLFCYVNDNLCEIRLNYDYKTLVGYVPVDNISFISQSTTYWHKTKPLSKDQTKNQIKLISKSKSGLDKTDKRFFKLVFKEV